MKAAISDVEKFFLRLIENSLDKANNFLII